MNKTQIIQLVAERSHVNELECQRIAKSYEKYCTKHLTRSTRTHLAEIADYIAKDTQLNQATCRRVVEQLFDVINSQLKSKLLFRK